MEIAVDIGNLVSTAEELFAAKLKSEYEEAQRKRREEMEKRSRLHKHGRKEMEKLLALVPEALKESAKHGYKTRDDKWHFEAKIPIAFAPRDELYSNRFNHHLLAEDSATIEAVESALYQLNRDNADKGMRFALDVTSSYKDKRPHPNRSDYNDDTTDYFLKVTVETPRK